MSKHSKEVSRETDLNGNTLTVYKFKGAYRCGPIPKKKTIPQKWKSASRRMKLLRKRAKYQKVRDVKWEKIMNEAFLDWGFCFKRQVVIGSYIVDFYFPDRKLIVEVYENAHKQKVEYDETRENYLRSLGFKFVAFWEETIGSDIKFCLEQILREPMVSDDEEKLAAKLIFESRVQSSFNHASL